MLLVDLYLYSKQNNKNDTDKAIESLSELLNHRAKELGYNVEDTYRNITGIKMKLQNIEFVFSKGETGLSAVSEMDTKISTFAIENFEQFNKEVNVIKKALSSDNQVSNFQTLTEQDDSLGTENDTLPFYKIYCCDLSEYDDKKIINQALSTRAINCLSRTQIRTVSDLLKLNRSEVLGIKFLGKKCISEIELFISSLCDKSSQSSSSRVKSETPELFTINKELVAAGDFSFTQDIELSDVEKLSLNKFKEAFEILGGELSLNCIKNPLYINNIVSALNLYINKTSAMLNKKHYLEDMVDDLPSGRRNKCNVGFINAYSADNNTKNILAQLFQNSELPISSISNFFEQKSDDFTYSLAKKFLKWCTFDIEKEIVDLFLLISENETRRTILSLRAQGFSLEQIGTQLGKTRERIRQIEVKAQTLFDHWEYTHKIILKIVAEHNGNRVLTPEDISAFCNENSRDFTYLVKNHESKYYIYDQQLDIIIIGDSSEIQNEIQAVIDALPEVININQIEQVVEPFCINTNVPLQAICLYVKKAYKITGDVYHSTRLSRSAVYSNIISRYYPNGIKAYDSDELLSFRSVINNEYGDINLPTSDRALTARIADCCILCGRGIYKPKQDKYVSDELIGKIEKYIDDNLSPIFMTNTIFDVFEDELSQYGITNKYFLQGVLRESFGDKYIFRRDYISKDKNITTLYSEIIDFLSQSPYPVSKEQIYEKYPGITEIVINFAVNDNCILNYFGEYLHSSKLKLNSNDIEYLRSTLNNKLQDGEPHHCKDLYDYVVQDNPFIMSSNSIFTQYSLFSVLEYLFANDFQFSRPYIANHNVSIGRPVERLRALIYSDDKFEISEISTFVKENRYQIQCLLDFFNSLNEDYFILDGDFLISIKATGITSEIANEVEKIILSEINEYICIKDLTCIHKLPKIKIPWTNWLIYSTINRWGEYLCVTTNTNFFKAAIPIIYLKDADEIDVLKVVNEQCLKDNSSEVYQADNLDDIDNLISDYIEEEL